MIRTPQNLIDALQSELKEKKISFAQIGKATGISTASLHGYANGTSEVAAQNMGKLAEYFQVDVEFLMGLGLYSHLSGSNKIDVARRFHRDAKAKEIFMQFVTERMEQIAAGDTRSNKAFVDYSTRMEQLKIEQHAERESLFKPLDEAFLQIPAELRKEAVLRLAELIK